MAYGYSGMTFSDACNSKWRIESVDGRLLGFVRGELFEGFLRNFYCAGVYRGGYPVLVAVDKRTS